MIFRFIDSGFNSPAMNMAIDEALLTSKKPVVRFYRWKPATLSIGYFQSVNKINLKKIKQLKLGFVRRPTGGKAVFHDKELTYSFIIDENQMPKDIVESYRIISTSIIIAFSKLGLNAEMQENIKKEKSPLCFNQPSYYEITIYNKKVVGSAQMRKNKKILQHGSILLSVDIERMCSLFNIESIEKSKNRIISINDVLKNRINYEMFAKILKLGFEENFKAKLVDDKLTQRELSLAKKLAREKYSKKEWNLLK